MVWILNLQCLVKGFRTSNNSFSNTNPHVNFNSLTAENAETGGAGECLGGGQRHALHPAEPLWERLSHTL